MFLVLALSGSLFAQVGIQARPCDSVQGGNNLALDFGGFCKYEAKNMALPRASTKRVVYLGDSITEGWGTNLIGLDQQDTINRGYSGQTTSQMRVRFRADVINLKPRILHFMAGTNDIAGNTGPTTVERIKDTIRSMCEEAQAHGIRVVIGSILPATHFDWRPEVRPAETIRTLNSWMKSYAELKGFIYADYYSALTDAQGGLPRAFSADGVHPNAAGYAVMAPIAAKAINDADKL